MRGKKTQRFLIVTHVPHLLWKGQLYAYGPYVREMNIWLQYVENYVLIAPKVEEGEPSKIDIAYSKVPIEFKTTEPLHFNSISKVFSSVFWGAKAFGYMIFEMNKASHIHLRCPGNMGLIGCIAQVFYPGKKKTAKYAGNWDPESAQPLSYRLQKYLLRSTTFTSNMQALVYGEWKDKTKNIKPFFTATYRNDELKPIRKPNFEQGINLIFVGVLEAHKSPQTLIEVARILKDRGINFKATFCGNGSQKGELEEQVKKYSLDDQVHILGNVPAEEVRRLLEESHFLIFISRSEGWPKAVAEAMFWGCVPLTTPVSCVGTMVGENGERGFLMGNDPEKISDKVVSLKDSPDTFFKISEAASQWSRTYTLDYFETEIGKLI